MKLLISTYAFKHKTLKDLFKELNILNIPAQITGGLSYEPEFPNKLSLFIKKHPKMILIHNYWLPQKNSPLINIISKDPDERRLSVDYIKKSIKFCGENNIKQFTFHAGFKGELTKKDFGVLESSEDHSDYDKYFLESINEILAFADNHKVLVGIENCYSNGDFNYSFLETYEDFKKIAHIAPKTNFLLDFGHLKISSQSKGINYEEECKKIVKEYSSKIIEVHLSSNDGYSDENNIPELGSFELEFTKKHLRHSAIVLEVNNFNPKYFSQISDFLFSE